MFSAVFDALDAVALATSASLQHKSGVRAERIDRVLQHLFQQQIHHRGQAHAMLSSTDVLSPQLDECFIAN